MAIAHASLETNVNKVITDLVGELFEMLGKGEAGLWKHNEWVIYLFRFSFQSWFISPGCTETDTIYD